MSQVLLEIIIIFLLLVANGVFAMTEIAIISAKKPRLRRLAEQGNSHARVALELAESPNRFLSTVQLGITLVGVIALIALFYKELLVSSFDAGLTASLGFNVGALHYGLMAVLSIVVVSAFEAVGAVMVVAMLIIPGMTAAQLSSCLPTRHWLVAGHSALSGLLGLHLSVWLNCSMARAMVVAGAGLFVLAWLFSPNQGLIRRWLRHPSKTPDETAWPEKATERPSP